MTSFDREELAMDDIRELEASARSQLTSMFEREASLDDVIEMLEALGIRIELLVGAYELRVRSLAELELMSALERAWRPGLADANPWETGRMLAALVREASSGRHEGVLELIEHVAPHVRNDEHLTRLRALYRALRPVVGEPPVGGWLKPRLR